MIRNQSKSKKQILMLQPTPRSQRAVRRVEAKAHKSPGFPLWEKTAGRL